LDFSFSGEEFHYTTHGFTLLSAVVENVVGEPFEKHMKRRFKELGLNNTYLDENEPLIYNRSR
jgi:serine beta-lactamase-like protein LACTB